MREIVPSADMPSTVAAAVPFAQAADDLAGLEIAQGERRLMLCAFLDSTDTDAMVILHRGNTACEFYQPGMSSATPHVLMSISKSLLSKDHKLKWLNIAL